MNKKLSKLIDQYFEEHHRMQKRDSLNNTNPPIIPTDSIPIMWHGDLEKFLQSEYKVITLSINPHFRAFHKDEAHFDMDLVRRLSKKKELQDNEKLELIQQYNTYFNQQRYDAKADNVFSRYEDILNSLNCSYFETKEYTNQALHLDLLSPLATNPLWSKLDKNVQKALLENGPVLNIGLIQFLNPDLIVASVNKNILMKTLKIDSTWNRTMFYKETTSKNNISGILFERSSKKILYGQYTRYGKNVFGHFTEDKFEHMIQTLVSKCKQNPTKSDFESVVSKLKPFQDPLATIHKAYKNGEFEAKIRNEDFVTYYENSEGYEAYKIQSLAKEIQKELLDLPKCSYSILKYIDIEEKHGISVPYLFDQQWTNDELYYYLIHIADEDDTFLIEQCMMNGELLGILSLFIERSISDGL